MYMLYWKLVTPKVPTMLCGKSTTNGHFAVHDGMPPVPSTLVGTCISASATATVRRDGSWDFLSAEFFKYTNKEWRETLWKDNTLLICQKRVWACCRASWKLHMPVACRCELMSLDGESNANGWYGRYANRKCTRYALEAAIGRALSCGTLTSTIRIPKPNLACEVQPCTPPTTGFSFLTAGCVNETCFGFWILFVETCHFLQVMAHLCGTFIIQWV